MLSTTTKRCGTCRFWQDVHEVEAGHKKGECCFQPPQLSVVPQATGIQGRANLLKFGFSPPCLDNRPACHEWQPPDPPVMAPTASQMANWQPR